VVTATPGRVRLLAILLVTLNLRGAITCVGPLLADLQARFGLDGTAAGLLTSLPLLAFGFLSPYAAPLGRRLGMEMAILVSMLLLVAGLGIRYFDGTLWLYLGTALIGCGIAFNNVLLPGLLRRDFADRVTFVTALFTMVLVTCGALGSGIAIPLAEWGGTRWALVFWIIPAVFGVLVWLPQLQRRSNPAAPASSRISQSNAHPRGSVTMWKQPIAWQVSLFMACQSTAFYVMVAWFPSMMLEVTATSPARSGTILFIYQMFVLASVMVTPLFIQRQRDQRIIGPVLSALILLAFVGLYFDPGHALAWTIVMGSGAGGSLVLAITLFSLRSASADDSVALSGMAQAIAYTMAAALPVLVGFLHDVTQQWTLPLLLMVALAAVQMLVGYLAGRPLTVAPARSPAS
jgi:CP family cyanate transporter-like MFS transporter